MVEKIEEKQEEKQSIVKEILKRTKVDFAEPKNPEDVSHATFKLQTEVDITEEQSEALDTYLPFYGRHAAINNLKREDNMVHLDMFLTAAMYDRCPTLRHRSTRIKGYALSSLQLHRSNPEQGGFERKAQVTAINMLNIGDDRRGNLYNPPKKKKGVLSRIFGKGEEDT
jgi:hypothetical protein